MAIEAVSYCSGTSNNPYRGRIALQIFDNERFVASYRHREVVDLWGGRLRPGTFTKACERLASAGFPEVPPVHELIPGEYPLELGWLVEHRWHRRETLDRHKFTQFVILTSTILSVLDSNRARMPPGETSPVIEQRRFDFASMQRSGADAVSSTYSQPLYSGGQALLDTTDSDAPVLSVSIIAAALEEEDRELIEQACLRLSAHVDEEVRGNAILGLGHVARRFGQLSSAAIETVKRGLADTSEYVRGQAHAAAGDVRHFVGIEVLSSRT
jgi:hypothetical protein